MADPSPTEIYQLKVTLKGIRPPIWRRLQVPGDVTLETLHTILQVAMGWWDAHLHQFIAKGTCYGMVDPDLSNFVEMYDESQVQLNQVVPGAKSKLIYEYDFGDSWEHQILVEKVLPAQAGQTYPVCLKGRRACPPEDVGGIWGYIHFLEAMADPAHPEHESYLDWFGEAFDPEAFDLAEINAGLKALE